MALQPHKLKVICCELLSNLLGFRASNPAFQEVFSLFDINGGGTIDAQELYSALSSVDIHLSQEEIDDVLCVMDEDGIDYPLQHGHSLIVFFL